MGTMDTGCLYSTLENISGESMVFSYLPPHGKELAANGQATVLGNVLDVVRQVGGERYVTALKNDIAAGRIAIVSTPNPILYDETLEQSQMLELDNDVVGVAAPCWETSIAP